MGTRDRRIGQVMAGATVGLTVLALTGCGDSREPSHLETPAVVWPDGEVTGAFPDEPAAQAVQDYAIAFAVAWNAVDYSDPAFVELIGIEAATEAAQQREEKRRTTASSSLYFTTMPGPERALVIDVVHEGSTTSVITCVTDKDAIGILVRYYLVEAREDGSYRLTRGSEGVVPANSDTITYTDACREQGIPQGLFEPAPTTDPDAKVVGPADASKYDLD